MKLIRLAAGSAAFAPVLFFGTFPYWAPWLLWAWNLLLVTLNNI